MITLPSTAQSLFYGTSISLLQFPTAENQGKNRTSTIVPPETINVPPLPECYCTVPDVVYSIDVTSVIEVKIPNNSTSVMGQEMEWIHHST